MPGRPVVKDAGIVRNDACDVSKDRVNMDSTKRNRSGFTLIELLTVIAIIAILAALLFPVFSRVRESVRQSSCFTNMHEIYRAVKLYKEDNNRYPAALLGFAQYTDANNTAQFYTTGSPGAPVTPTNLTYKPLFNGQKYLKDLNVFTCPDINNQNKGQDLPPVTAVYPANLGAQSGLSGATVVFNAIVQHNTGNDANASYPLGKDAYFYPFDTYDIGTQLMLTGNSVSAVPGSHERHYSLDWTGNSGPQDPKNQLKYGQNAPEDSTVLTWCTEHAATAGSDKVLVLMLSGKTIPADSKQFVSKGPLNFIP